MLGRIAIVLFIGGHNYREGTSRASKGGGHFGSARPPGNCFAWRPVARDGTRSNPRAAGNGRVGSVACEVRDDEGHGEGDTYRAGMGFVVLEMGPSQTSFYWA